jgi:serpin B
MNRSQIALLLTSFLLCLAWLFNQNYFKATAFMSSQKSESQVTTINQIASTTTIEQSLVKANRKFAFQLFSQVNQQEKQKNIFISPNSVAIALSLLYNGADGNTQEQMAQVLELSGLELAEINQAYYNLQNLLENNAEVELSIANSLWLRQGFPVASEFLANNQKYYQAEVEELDFNQPQAKDIINNWVAKETKNKITEIIDSIDPRDVLFLINAIYFKGIWTNQFDPNLTQNQPFYPDGKTQINHDFMSQNGQYFYLENEQFQAIKLPYGEQKSLSMYIFLPQEKINLSSFLQNLTAEKWQQWLDNFAQKEGFISLPKFKLEYEINLNDTLQAMGMTDIFSNKANFSKMTSEEVMVSEVKHKTFIEVNEEGTEAAAVTSIGVRATSIEITQPFRMIVDRPFFYAIQDNQTDTILFMGKVLNPSK